MRGGECAGHLGKFDSCRDEALYLATLDQGDADRTVGEMDFGCHASLLTLDGDEWLPIDGADVLVPAGSYIVEAVDSGAVYVGAYSSLHEANAEMDRVEALYEAWLGDEN
jgi:hypothetical protein